MTFWDRLKAIGAALGAWGWLLKVIGIAILGMIIFGFADGWMTAKKDLAREVELRTKLQDQIVAKDATARDLRREKDSLLAASAGLAADYAALEKKVGRLTVHGTADISTPVGGATAHGAPRDPVAGGNVIVIDTIPTKPEPAVLLRLGDKGHIRALALSLETQTGNSVLLFEGRCYRDVPGPIGTEILRDTGRVDVSEVLRLAPPKDPGVGVGPMLGLSGGRLVYGAMVSPATFNTTFIHPMQFELLLGAAANATGDWSAMAAALGRVR